MRVFPPSEHRAPWRALKLVRNPGGYFYLLEGLQRRKQYCKTGANSIGEKDRRDSFRIRNDIPHRKTNVRWIAISFLPDEAIRIDIGYYPLG